MARLHARRRRDRDPDPGVRSRGPPLTSSHRCLNLPPMAATERVNLNLPAQARERLRSLAKAANKPEAVLARSLLVKAIEREERAAFRRRLEASRTPERRARDIEIAAALEQVRG
jgi:hypothetical protein